MAKKRGRPKLPDLPQLRHVFEDDARFWLSEHHGLPGIVGTAPEKGVDQAIDSGQGLGHTSAVARLTFVPFE